MQAIQPPTRIKISEPGQPELFLTRVPGAPNDGGNLFTITGYNTRQLGWRAIYLGYNTQQDVSAFHMSRYRRLIPDNHIKDRRSERLAEFGFKRELKISNGLQPSTFWGDFGKILLQQLNVFLNFPDQRKHLPQHRSIIFPFVPSSNVLQVWINGVYVASVVNNEENQQFIKSLQEFTHLKPATIEQALQSFQLPELPEAN